MQEYRLGQSHDEEPKAKAVEAVKTSEEGVQIEEAPKVVKKKRGSN